MAINPNVLQNCVYSPDIFESVVLYLDHYPNDCCATSHLLSFLFRHELAILDLSLLSTFSEGLPGILLSRTIFSLVLPEDAGIVCLAQIFQLTF